MDMVKESPDEAAKWMAEAFGMKPDDVMAMRKRRSQQPISPRTYSSS